jgi:phenylacetaldehyde dehydrogenase
LFEHVLPGNTVARLSGSCSTRPGAAELGNAFKYDEDATMTRSALALSADYQREEIGLTSADPDHVNMADVHPNVRAFLSQRRPMLIGGDWVFAQSGKTFKTTNPATEEVLADVAEGDKADIDLAVAAARAALESPDWKRMPPSARGVLMFRLADLIEKHGDELAQLDVLDNGKPISVARFAEQALAVDVFRYMAGWATKIEGRTIPVSAPYAQGAEFLSYTRREPIGVVGAIIPWNIPLVMACWKLAPALAAGCTIVLKPAEQTPLSALRLGELIMEAGFPKGVVNIVPGFGETAGAALAAHPGVDKVAFTGSTEVGRLIVKAAAGNLKKVSLELGGKSPVVVFKDADLDRAIMGATSGIFFNGGQNCMAGTRLYVEKGAYDYVVAGVSKQAKELLVGPGMNVKTEMGPMVTKDQADRVSRYIEIGQEDGAEIVTGGHRFHLRKQGYFVEPTVLSAVKPTMRVQREEIFGPVITVVPFSTAEEVTRLANDSEFGLSSAVWTRDINRAHYFASQVKAGTCYINTANIWDSAVPYGGYKQSGWGRELGEESLDAYLQTKAVTMQYPM